MKSLIAIALALLSATLIEGQGGQSVQAWRGGHGSQWGWGRGGHGWRGAPGRGMPAPVSTGNATFTQLIDHKNPHLGTFQQFYYWSSAFWKGPGSPVVILTPGEVAAAGYQGYLGNRTITGAIAEKIGAAVVVVEHRYWGESSPYAELTTANLQYLTLDNSIQDLVYFAKHVQLPFLKPGVKSNADHVPWVLAGGSYAGALTAWTAAKAPGTFWAYLASSAVVETISDFWEYFIPVQEGMPQNCSADVSRVVDYMDNIWKHGTTAQKSDLKAKFGLQSLQHYDDVMGVLEFGPWQWQSTDFAGDYGGFFQWCDYVENSVNVTDASKLPGASGVGVQKALDGYAKWIKEVFLPNSCYDTYGYDSFQGVDNYACWDTYNTSNPLFTDVSVSNTWDRQWWWFLCNEPFGYWQDGAPAGRSSIVSRLINAAYSTRQCAILFPPGPNGETYGINKGDTEDQTNAQTGGWFIDNTTRLIYTNGEWDPWRYATVSSDFRPGGRLQSTTQVPVNVIPEGRHCSDLLIKNGEVNAGCKAVQDSEILQISKWVSEFPKQHYWQA